MRTKRKRESTWQGCYDAGWRGLIADEAFAHPAKFARNLIGRIYRHMLERGWLAPGMTVVDPFGGVALGALDAMANGLHWCGCELEPKFHTLGNANITEWVRRYGHSAGWGSARLLQGDSRRLCEVVGGADCVVSSPPYAESFSGDKVESADLEEDMRRRGCSETAIKKAKGHGHTGSLGYGTTDGQLGSMKAGSVDAVLGSPPYASSLNQGETVDPEKIKERERRYLDAHPELKGVRPPFESYGDAAGNLGNLKAGTVEAVVSSPPYEAVGGVRKDGDRKEYEASRGYEISTNFRSGSAYGQTTGQLGTEVGETFWHAAREIVQQCHAILRPGGIAAWVTKDFVRNKARVPFSADWLKLCEACGFELVEWVKASLVKDLGKHADLYGETHHRTVERKSFFRRLAEKKGSPRIDWEDVLFVRKR